MLVEPFLIDVFSKGKRSEIMSKIRSKGTKLDITMMNMLSEANLPYELYPQLCGSPDFLVGHIVIFCDSSFWHGKNWNKLKKKLAKGNNPSYWVSHIAKNRRRDRVVSGLLKTEGYGVLRFWDDEIYKHQERCVAAIKKELKSSCSQ